MTQMIDNLKNNINVIEIDLDQSEGLNIDPTLISEDDKTKKIIAI